MCHPTTARWITTLGMLASASLVQADTALTTIRVADGLVRPIGVTYAPGDYDRVFVIEKQGTIRIMQNGSLLPMPFLDVTAETVGGTTDWSEQGLLGLAFHPDYQNNGFLYINFTGAGGVTTVRRYTVSANPSLADPGSGFTVLTIAQPQDNHNGGWMGFGPGGFLYIATGDGGGSGDNDAGHTTGVGNGQDITNNLLGKILRVDVDGDGFPADPGRNYSVPGDNPFVGIDGDDEIWAFGLRNPWRNSFDRQTGDLWLADVGQGDWEEINFQPVASTGGTNYGWRCREGKHDFDTNGDCSLVPFEEPIYEYSHVLGCSITGGYVYRGCAIPDLQGAYFFADYCSNNIWSFRYDGISISGFLTRTGELAPGGGLAIGSITSFGEDAFGEIYICDQSGGEVFKIVADVPGGFLGGDCNTNNVDDACEIEAGLVNDANQDAVPDTCQCIGDLDADDQTGLTDLQLLLAAYGACVGDPDYSAAADIVPDNCVNLTDLQALLSDYGCVLTP